MEERAEWIEELTDQDSCCEIASSIYDEKTRHRKNVNNVLSQQDMHKNSSVDQEIHYSLSPLFNDTNKVIDSNPILNEHFQNSQLLLFTFNFISVYHILHHFNEALI